MKQKTDTDSNPEWQNFQSGIAHLAIPLTSQQNDQLRQYWNSLVKWSTAIHLTSKNDYARIPTRHILDSLLPHAINLIKPDEHICDFGTGAGFPGIPLAIAIPTLTVTLIESNLKKTTFLKRMITELNLNNTNVIHDRIENLKDTHNKTYTAGTVRAVSSLNTIIPLCLPLLRHSGRLICYKGPDYQQELDRLEPKLRDSDLKIMRISAPQLPLQTVLIEITNAIR